MDSINQRDRISSLPDVVLVMILSFLSFKDNIKTSVLSKRWRTLCYETGNISFKESEYVDHSVSDFWSKRVSFVHYMLNWVSRVPIEVIKSFEICLGYPVGFEAEIKYLIEFSISRQVKNLVLDFSSHYWRNTWDGLRYDDFVIELPTLFYGLQTLESLKIYACWFDPSRFTNLGLRKLSIGWFRLKKIESMLSKCPLLESLSIISCYLDEVMLAGNIRELIMENCIIPTMYCALNLPNIDIFKYSGNVIVFDFQKVNMILLKEVYLDFGIEHDNDEPIYSPNKEAGDILSHLLNDLRSSRTLTVCPYLLEVIPECNDPVDMLRDVVTQHLVLETLLHPKEFTGIRLLLDHCPNLETLTLELLCPRPFPMPSCGGISSQTLWLENISSRCLRRTLKILVVRGFCNSWNEFYLLNYLVRPENGYALERVELYMPTWLKGTQRQWAHFGAAMLQSTSNRVQVVLHNGWCIR
ncbi:F-box domain [Arabidopsis thaliana x Arabidopsis arenosa]|uniref:F-box domain n=1 Tax=Arabidopsis thaliana x Arabidopsis arenosa TaxID=1240361 RepID=A0A8T1ZJD7_9BRAS|nr:F-box domain [Arabidopsis thaliana x Arabidopsis arenosa]